ncbi:hypothetical protein MXB_3202 [Myxobolus squamalis]|nr:hypothetical protein MXB_3202 [Myxobolus squamalis]
MFKERVLSCFIVAYLIFTEHQLFARLVDFPSLFSKSLKEFSGKYSSDLFFRQNHYDPNVNQSLFRFEPFDDPIILSHASSVIEKSCGKWVNVLIFIVSNPIHFEARNLIRRSYGKIQKSHDYYR